MKITGALAGCLLAVGVDAFRSIIEHPDVDYIEYKDRTSHRAEPVKLNFNKYEALADTTEYTKQKAAATQLWEYVFGLSEEETLFKDDLEHYMSSQTRRSRRSLLGSI